MGNESEDRQGVISVAEGLSLPSCREIPQGLDLRAGFAHPTYPWAGWFAGCDPAI